MIKLGLHGFLDEYFSVVKIWSREELSFSVCLYVTGNYCTLESSYLGRLSAIKVQLELELYPVEEIICTS